MNRSRFRQAATAVAICATVAAMVGIATGAAAPSKNERKPRAGAFGDFPGPPPGAKGLRLRVDGPRPIGGPPVHSEIVVPNEDGDDFVTVTQDSGRVKSVSGDQLTITEGTEEVTYQTVTLDIPSDAKVLRNGKQVELGDLQVGDQVHVSQSPRDSFVFATDGDFFEKSLRKRGGVMRHLRGLPPPPGIGGLPPGIPPAATERRGNN